MNTDQVLVGLYAHGVDRKRGNLMTLKEAAAILGTSPDNLRGAIARGALRAAKHGRDWWVAPAEVERYRREHLRGESVRSKRSQG